MPFIAVLSSNEVTVVNHGRALDPKPSYTLRGLTGAAASELATRS